MQPHVLIIDDEITIRQTVQMLLADQYRVSEAPNSEIAYQLLRDTKIDIIFLDIHLE